jgi:hypothetical protein
MKEEKEKKLIPERLENSIQTCRFISLEDMNEVRKIKPSILLHSCCGPCSTAVVERLSGRFEVTISFTIQT